MTSSAASRRGFYLLTKRVGSSTCVGAPTSWPTPGRSPATPARRERYRRSARKRGVESGDAAEGGGAADAVLAESTGRISAGIKAGYGLAAKIHHLGAGVDPDARITVVERGRVPRRVERRLGNL